MAWYGGAVGSLTHKGGKKTGNRQVIDLHFVVYIIHKNTKDKLKVKDKSLLPRADQKYTPQYTKFEVVGGGCPSPTA